MLPFACTIFRLIDLILLLQVHQRNPEPLFVPWTLNASRGGETCHKDVRRGIGCPSMLIRPFILAGCLSDLLRLSEPSKPPTLPYSSNLPNASLIAFSQSPSSTPSPWMLDFFSRSEEDHISSIPYQPPCLISYSSSQMQVVSMISAAVIEAAPSCNLYIC